MFIIYGTVRKTIFLKKNLVDTRVNCYSYFSNSSNRLYSLTELEKKEKIIVEKKPSIEHNLYYFRYYTFVSNIVQ